MRRVAVFCGSRSGNRAEFTASAISLATLLAREKIGLVYGGGNVGLMGVIADAALAGGGEVIGVIPQSLVDRELAHRQLTELHIVPSMHARKAEMEKLSDGFISLPGAFGTADETFEILTWAQLGLHRKPVALLNVAGFFDPLLAWLDHTVAEGFLKPKHRGLLIHEATPAALLERMKTYQSPEVTGKWIDETQT